MMFICTTCKLEAKQMSRCKSCRATCYCSYSCQKIDWKRHKSQCMKLGRMRDFTEKYLESSKTVKEALVACASIYCDLYSKNTINVTLEEEDGSGIFTIDGSKGSSNPLSSGRICLNLFHADTKIEMQAQSFPDPRFHPIIFKNSTVQEKLVINHNPEADLVTMTSGDMLIVLQ